MAPKKPTGTTGADLVRFYTSWAKDEGVDLDPSDVSLIERLSAATDAARELEAAVIRSGAVVLTEAGNAKPHPALPALRGQTELCAKLTTMIDRRITDAAAGDDAVNRGGVRPFETRGMYSKAATGDTPPAVRLPARTPRTKRR